MDEQTAPEARAEADAAEIRERRQRRAARRQARASLQAKVDADAAIAKAAASSKGPAGAGQAIARVEPTQVAVADQGGAIAPSEHDQFEAARIAREARMLEIRGELRRRRRWRSVMMLVRFIVFVLGPTAFVGWYYYEKATDMYVSESALVFKSGGTAVGGGGLLGGLLGNTPTDSVALQEYLLSRDIVERLEREHGWISHFQSEDIDEWHRLSADATIDDAHAYYAGNLLWAGKMKVSYDTLEGIVRLEVTGATPEAAKRFSDAVISYGEELVNQLNERSRNDGVRMASKQVLKAREGLRDAQRQVAAVQEQLNIFSVESEAGALQAEITALEAEIRAIDAQIENLKTITTNPNDTRFVPLRTARKIKVEQVEALRNQLTGGGDVANSGPSMAQLSSELELARVDQVAAQMMYSSAITSQETAIAQAAQQSLFLETVVQPKAPERAAKPYRLQNTGLVFLILFAAYIIGLLTISLIREQAAI